LIIGTLFQTLLKRTFLCGENDLPTHFCGVAYMVKSVNVKAVESEKLSVLTS